VRIDIVVCEIFTAESYFGSEYCFAFTLFFVTVPLSVIALEVVILIIAARIAADRVLREPEGVVYNLESIPGFASKRKGVKPEGFPLPRIKSVDCHLYRTKVKRHGTIVQYLFHTRYDVVMRFIIQFVF